MSEPNPVESPTDQIVWSREIGLRRERVDRERAPVPSRSQAQPGIEAWEFGGLKFLLDLLIPHCCQPCRSAGERRIAANEHSATCVQRQIERGVTL